MLNKEIEYYYDVILNIFLGIIIIIILYNFYDAPRVVVFESDKEFN